VKYKHTDSQLVTIPILYHKTAVSTDHRSTGPHQWHSHPCTIPRYHRQWWNQDIHLMAQAVSEAAGSRQTRERGKVKRTQQPNIDVSKLQVTFTMECNLLILLHKCTTCRM